MGDRRIIYAAAFLRAAVTSMAAVLLGLLLARRGLDASASGAVVALGLSGVAAAVVLVTLRGDLVGRRASLVGLAALGAAGHLGLAYASDAVALGAWAFIGMVNGMGRDRGAALVIEQAALPSTAPDAARTRVFAWYNVWQDAGHALGALAAGAVSTGDAAASTQDGWRRGFWIAAASLALTAALYLLLSRAVEAAPVTGRRRAASPATRRIIGRLAALFGLDGLGSGFLTTALLSYFFFERFNAAPEWIAALFFGARVLNAASHIAAAWLARRIGLVNTMVFTHIPSSLLLLTVAIAPNFPIAAALFLLREGLVEMDVPTRQSYLMAVVPPDDRTVAAGVTGLVRLCAWAVSPFLAGLLSESVGLLVPLFVGAGLKIAYDIALYSGFRSVKPPEERGRSAAVAPLAASLRARESGEGGIRTPE